MAKPNQAWVVHLLTAAVVVVSLGLPFVNVSFTAFTSSGRVEFEDSASFLGRGIGRAGGDQAPLPGTTLSSDEAVNLAESITDPLDLTIPVHVAAILVALALIRTPRGAMLGLAGGVGGLALTLLMLFSMSQRASVVEEIVGPGLDVDFGPGSILAPLAFGLAAVWSGARLVLGRSKAETSSARVTEGTMRSIGDRERTAGAGTPSVIRGVGWYLVVLAALGVLVLTSPGARSGMQMAWRLPVIVLTAAAGIGLILQKRWAYMMALVLGGLSAVSAVPMLVSMLSDPIRAGILLLPGLAMVALLVAPFALLLRRDSRLWFGGT